MPVAVEDLRGMVKAALHRVAPEADLDALPGGADLREEIDLDSMDMLNFLVALGQNVKVDIAERDYGRLRSIDGCVSYLQEKLR